MTIKDNFVDEGSEDFILLRVGGGFVAEDGEKGLAAVDDSLALLFRFFFRGLDLAELVDLLLDLLLALPEFVERVDAVLVGFADAAELQLLTLDQRVDIQLRLLGLRQVLGDKRKRAVPESCFDRSEHCLIDLFQRDGMGDIAPAVCVVDALQRGSADRQSQAAAAVRALDKSVQHVGLSGRGAVISAVFLLVLGDQFLRGAENVLLDDRLMLTVHDHHVGIVVVAARPALGIPADLANIDRIAQDVFDRSVFPAVAPGRADAERVQIACDLNDRLAADEVRIDLPDKRSGLRIDDVFLVDDVVAERRDRHSAAAFHLLGHSATHLAGQTDGIILVRPFDDALDQRAERTVEHGLRNADDLNAVFAQHGFVEDALFLVTRESREFPQQYCRKRRRLLLGGGDHLVERRALVGMPAADTVVAENVLLWNQKPVILAVLAHDLDLAVRRQLGLTVRRHADICRRGSDICVHEITFSQIYAKKGAKIPCDFSKILENTREIWYNYFAFNRTHAPCVYGDRSI